MGIRICRKSNEERQLPNFTLASIEGTDVSLWDFRDRYNVVIYLFDPSNSNDIYALRAFGMKDAEFADANTEIIAIAEKPDRESIEKLTRMRVPFHILLDSDGIIRKKLMLDRNDCLAVVDRYGLLLILCSECISVDATLEEIIAELETIEMQCPECGGNVWKINY